VRLIGDTLGVRTVLEGSVRRSADRIRITAQLIDARTGYHLWSDTYDRPLTDLFSVQDAISREIVSALAGKFTTSKAGLYRGGTKDVQAYDLYLLGRQKWATRQVPLLREAVQHFEQAIARDSGFALAWSGHADAIIALAWRSPSEIARVPVAKHAAQRAVLLDAELAEGWASLGVMATYIDRDFSSAELAFRRALALRPSYAPAYHWLADVMEYSGRLEQAVELSTRAIELDPVNGFYYGSKVEQLQSAGRFAEARQDADRMLAMGYREREVFLTILSGARPLGYDAEEAAEFGRGWATSTGFPRPDDAAVIGGAHLEPSLRPRAREFLKIMAGEQVRPRDLAMLSLGIEDFEGAIKYLEQAMADGDPSLLVIGTVRTYDPLRKDPRFIRIIEQLGVANGL